jgi:hypothetical protein
MRTQWLAVVVVGVIGAGCGALPAKREVKHPLIDQGMRFAERALRESTSPRQEVADPDPADVTSYIPAPRVSLGMMTGTVCSSEVCRGQYGALLTGFGLVTAERAHAYLWIQTDIVVGLRELCIGTMCGGELPMTGSLMSGIGLRYGRVRGEVGGGVMWAGRALGEDRVLGVNALGGRAAIGVDVLRWPRGALAVRAEHQGAVLPFGGVHATGVTVAVHHAVF